MLILRGKHLFKHVDVGRHLAFFTAGVIFSLVAFSFCGGDDYDLFLLQKRWKAVNKAIEYNINLITTYQTNQSEADNTPEQNTGSVVTNSVTSGTGLNLMLINNIQTECFVKEYLAISAENQNGELDTMQHAKSATVQMIIGINVSESGYYSAGGGGVLPKTDLPEGSDGAPIWNNGTNSLKNWSSNEHSNGGATALGGPFQYISGGTITGINTVSKYNKGTSTGGGKGDCYLFPDAVCGLNGYIDSAISWIGSSDMSDGALAVAAVMSHNRGAGGLAMMYGIPYATIFSGHTSSYLKNKQSGDLVTALDEVYDDATSVPSGTDVEGIASSSGYVCQLFSYISNGWYFSPNAANNVLNYNTDRTRALWNQLFPNEQVNSAQEFVTAVQKHTSKLSIALGISDSECDRIYGTTNGEYLNYNSRSPRGDIFKVLGNTTGAYTVDNAKQVISLEAMCAQHVFNTMAVAAKVYAKMLKYAGVNVDPTDPSTYMGGYSSSGEWTPAGEPTETTLIANGLDVKTVTVERMKVLKAAANLVGIDYKQCRHFAGCDGFCFDNMTTRPTHLDCSAFVWRAYADAGFNMSGFPTSTAMYGTTSAFTEITVDELKPGDAIVRTTSPRHVEIFLGNENGVASMIEAFRPGKQSGFCKKNISEFTDGKHKFYRFTQFAK